MAQNRDYYAVILAGGSGTRFWPMSRQSYPKQFLSIANKGSLLEQTVKRISSLIKGENILIVTNKRFKKEIEKQLKSYKIPSKNILLEPEGKNTAPAICWAAVRIYQMNPKAVMAVLPSDHLIVKTQSFLKLLRKAKQLANEDYLVTLGIVPTRPETGYGYLKTAQRKVKNQSITIVEKFTEKPSLSVAKKFVKQKKYFWNSGMFIWRAEVILEEFKKLQPSIYKLLGSKSSTNHINRVWKKLPSISIDYGILENAKKVAAVPANNIGWSDLGSWESLSEELDSDKKGNIIKGDVLAIDNKDCMVFSQHKFVAAIGLNNVTVVDTKDALLICRTDQSQKVKDVVTTLLKQKRNEI